MRRSTGAVWRLALLATLLGGCGVSEHKGADDGLDRSAQIARVADGVYDAMGVTSSRVAFDYERRPESSCAMELGIAPGLGAGQAWYARQSYALKPGTYDYGALLDAAAAHFRADGWETRTYRKSANLRAVIALKGDVGVIVTVPPVEVTVSAGPCGRSVSALGAAYVLQPG